MRNGTERRDSLRSADSDFFTFLEAGDRQMIKL